MSTDKTKPQETERQTTHSRGAAEPAAEPAPRAETEIYVPQEAEGVSDVRPVSDVQLAESVTAAAPSFRAPAAAVRVSKPPVRRDQRPPALLPGAQIHDFEIVRLLGRGAFGHVYLARQLSLDREVALKVSANCGSEGRTMARLEHAHIVQVFSENVDTATDQRLLCMQLVPGVGLERIIGALNSTVEARGSPDSETAGEPPTPTHWTGADLLAIIDRNASLPAALDPAALRDRETLSRMDAVETTAWIGARLAEALDFAHHHGVLHRDIKPANILVDPYGRPMLADFNISSFQLQGEGEEMFGGTVAYMAPEHLDAFNPADETPHDAVAEPADMYSLGMVLQELLEGRRLLRLPPPNASMVDTLRALSDERRRSPPACCADTPNARKTLEQTICRCLAPDPADRFASGATLAEQLDGCRQLRQAERQLPRPSALVQRIMARPFLWFVVLVLLPQLAGSVLNISYNLSQVASQLTVPGQKQMFMQLVNGYNAVAYPVALALFAWVVLRVRRVWQAMHGVKPLTAGQVTDARRRALQLPLWVAGLTVCGWLPGGVLFPAVIAARTEPLDVQTWLHFIASFSLSGLIALAYALCGSQFVVQRALYPRMWNDVRQFSATARRELAPMATRLSWIQALAGSIPLAAAVLMLALGGTETHPAFRWIVTGLIILGMAGYELAKHVTRSLTDTAVALAGAKA